MTTPTDVAAWLALAPWALLLGYGFLAFAWFVENTDTGRAFTDWLLEWIER